MVVAGGIVVNGRDRLVPGPLAGAAGEGSGARKPRAPGESPDELSA